MRFISKFLAVLVSASLLAACSNVGGGLPQAGTGKTNDLTVTHQSDGSTRLAAFGETAVIPSGAELTVGVPYHLPWGTLTRQMDGSISFQATDGRSEVMQMLKNGNVSVAMNWYSNHAVVITPDKWGSAQYAGPHAIRPMISTPTPTECATLKAAEKGAELTFWASLGTAALVVGGNLLADFATMGAALFATMMNITAVAAAAGAYQSWQASKSSYVEAGC